MGTILFRIVFVFVFVFMVGGFAAKAVEERSLDRAVEEFLAAERGNIDKAQKGIHQGLNEFDGGDWVMRNVNNYWQTATPLHIAAQDNDVDEVKKLLGGGMPIDSIMCDPVKNEQDYPQAITPLFLATRFNRLETIGVLLEHGAQPNTGGHLPLADATERKLVEAVRLLLRYGANPNSLGHHYEDISSALSMALFTLFQAPLESRVELVKILLDAGADPADYLKKTTSWGDSELAKLLLENGANPNQEDKYHPDNSPLDNAASKSYIDFVRLLIDYGAKVKEVDAYDNADVKAFFAMHAGYERSPLHRAAEKGDIATLRQLLDDGADIDGAGPIGEPPITHAIMGGHTDAVAFLLANGAGKTKANNCGWTPAFYAARFADARVFALVFDREEDVDRQDSDGQTLLYQAAKNGDTEIVEQLIKAGARVEPESVDIFLVTEAKPGQREKYKPLKFYTPLHFAAREGNLGAVKLLVENGADVNRRGDRHWGWPALLAARRYKYDVVEYLASKGATLHHGFVERKPAETPRVVALYDLFLGAARDGNFELVRICLDHGVPVDYINLLGQTILSVLCEEFFAMGISNWEMIELLLAHGADVNARGNDGKTPLHRLAGALPWDFDKVKMKNLLRAGADAAARDNEGLTPLHYAAAMKNERAMKILLQAQNVN